MTTAYAPIVTARTADDTPDRIAAAVQQTTNTITRLVNAAATTDPTDRAALDTLYADAAAHSADLADLFNTLAARNIQAGAVHTS